jgi:hypothetical protein
MDEDPHRPAPAIAALRAMAQIRGFRSWEPVKMCRAIREALQEPQEYGAYLPGGS